MRRYGEYIQLVNEKQRLSEKILELERQGVDRIAHRTAHQPFLPTVSTAFLQDSIIDDYTKDGGLHFCKIV